MDLEGEEGAGLAGSAKKSRSAVSGRFPAAHGRPKCIFVWGIMDEEH